jgi:hypothetical protein
MYGLAPLPSCQKDVLILIDGAACIVSTNDSSNLECETQKIYKV